jgi:glycosyltransferase involved in cell wall biosynthesis
MITVTIPTTNRPHYLRTALKSVQRQTALARITEIVVSENAGSRTSEDVCREFAALPIRYIFRDPPVGPEQHGFLLLREASNKFIAILHDDDWWAPNHIENGAKQLASNTDLSCYYSAYFMVGGERTRLQCHSTLEFWAGAGFPSFENAWTLTLADTAVACLVDVPCHYSSMIGSRACLQNAYDEVLESGNRYDNDRTITLALAKQGSIVVNPTPEVFVRFHPGQAKNRSSDKDVKRFKKVSVEYLLELCRQEGIDLGREFDLRMAAAPKDDCQAVCDAILRNYEFIVSRRLIGSKVLNDYWQQTASPTLNTMIPRLLKRILPPVIRDWGRMLLREK